MNGDEHGIDADLYPHGLTDVQSFRLPTLWDDANPQIVGRARPSQPTLLTTAPRISTAYPRIHTSPVSILTDTEIFDLSSSATHTQQRSLRTPAKTANANANANATRTGSLYEIQSSLTPSKPTDVRRPSSLSTSSVLSSTPHRSAFMSETLASPISEAAERDLSPAQHDERQSPPQRSAQGRHAATRRSGRSMTQTLLRSVLPHPSLLPSSVASVLRLPLTKQTGRSISFPAGSQDSELLLDPPIYESQSNLAPAASRARGFLSMASAEPTGVEMHSLLPSKSHAHHHHRPHHHPLLQTGQDSDLAASADSHSDVSSESDVGTYVDEHGEDDRADGYDQDDHLEDIYSTMKRQQHQTAAFTPQKSYSRLHPAKSPQRLKSEQDQGKYNAASMRQQTAMTGAQSNSPKADPSTVKSDAPETYPNYKVEDYPPNVVRNQKYHPATFLFVVLYEQFKFFFNLYFLGVAITQFFPILQIGFLFTYLAPLAFVLAVTISKEAYDDFKRHVRDKEANSQLYGKLTPQGVVQVPSSDLRVGDFVVVLTDQRIPADLIMLRTTEKGGASFIRTDQLDGETDWKLRQAVPSCQQLSSDEELFNIKGRVRAGRPNKEIYNFVGTCKITKMDGDQSTSIDPLSLENTLWANTVLASGRIVGLVIYTGCETRSVMNASTPSTKVGLLDKEINRYSKILFALTISLSFILIALKGFEGIWYIYFFRFILLFSSIIPISLRVNLDMGKTVYSAMIMTDKEIPETIVRTSTIPEELGRITYLLSDKTGTLTKNEMIFKKLHVGVALFTVGALDDLQSEIDRYFTANRQRADSFSRESTTPKAMSAIYALALSHSVTPVREGQDSSEDVVFDTQRPGIRGEVSYHACSPDEIALVKFAESVGLALEHRTRTQMYLRTPANTLEGFDILNTFPFTSETKRMGIILREHATDRIVFYMKGADTVMMNIVQESDWLAEECGNMARSGLRTLVFGRKYLTTEQYNRFAERYQAANASLENRSANIRAVIDSLESDLELICLTGVEDQLQDHVKETLEMLRNAGIKIWMLTGDKVETATCIAISAKLVSRNQTIFTLIADDQKSAEEQLSQFSRKVGACLVIDGKSLAICMDNFPTLFADYACKAPSVVCCRCSPTQKADVVHLLKEFTKKKTCAIGDGGNDVSMIQAADIGLGIVGKEGKQASLAADFSINQFSYVQRLLLWHGRNSYKRSARLAQFVIHRGLIISIIQAVFSALYYYAAVAIYNGWLLVG
eukprot:TRINITY_DN2292_c0_g1_i8.p1 TRINITY_DN2292_c0_g1~~TRINITY_DN2292_c0_g1_i8.p1  ORF type:complete len:1252 (+),score=261.63 TRINITY_DN2292_c0_g1_i8:42-3797(+)